MSTRSYVAVRERLLDDESAAALAETFKVLGDPTRVRILDALARSEVAVCDLAELLGVTQSAVSHQLRLLRSMRLVRSRRDGRHIYYTVDDDQLFAYAPGRRDFFRAGDDGLWAHESHGWLVAAESGETLAHRTGDVYYGAVDGERLYRVTADPVPEVEKNGSGTDQRPRPRRAAHRVVRTRH